MIGGTSGSWHRKLIQTSGTLALALFEESEHSQALFARPCALEASEPSFFRRCEAAKLHLHCPGLGVDVWRESCTAQTVHTQTGEALCRSGDLHSPKLTMR